MGFSGFFSLSMPLLAKAAAETISTVFVFMGASTLLLATFFHCQTVWLTKNTAGLVMKFMKFSCGTAIVMGLASIFGIIAKPSMGAVLFMNIAFLIINIASFLANAFTYKVKVANMKAAQAAGMTEQEHYEKVILPSLNLQK